MKADYLFKNAGIIDETGTFFTRKSVTVHEGVIQEVLEETDELPVAESVIDCSRLVITPGLVNLHTHSPMCVFRGIAEDVTIDDWFNSEIWPYESRMQPQHAYAGALAAIYEMTNCGVTAFADHYPFAKSIIRAVKETGIRCDLAPTLFGLSTTFNEDLEHAAALTEECQSDKRLQLRMGPHAPYTTPPAQLKQIVDTAKMLHTGIHIHLSETRQQVIDSLEQFKRTPFEILAEAGGFDVPLIIAHGLWIQPDDRKLLTPYTTIAVSPKTYLKLAMGQGNIWDEADSLPLAAGTDGAASSNTLNPIEQIRLYGLLGKHFHEDAEMFTLKSLWQILMRGHKALDFNTGRIAPGKCADLTFWNLSHVEVMPVHNPLAAILYSAGSNQVEHVMVAGEWTKFEGSVLMDREKISASLMEQSLDLMDRGKGKMPFTF